MHVEDSASDLEWCAKKLMSVKLWSVGKGEDERMWRANVKDVEGEVLVVSQFTLYGTITKKQQPDFRNAAKSDTARKQYETFLALARIEGIPAGKSGKKPDAAKVATTDGGDYVGGVAVRGGVFGAMMDVGLVNDGPVTLIVDSREKGGPSFAGGGQAPSPSPPPAAGQLGSVSDP